MNIDALTEQRTLLHESVDVFGFFWIHGRSDGNTVSDFYAQRGLPMKNHRLAGPLMSLSTPKRLK
jgi:hypothetical protein